MRNVGSSGTDQSGGIFKKRRRTGYKTCGKSINLSGGQCQRLAPRALLHDSPVYIFDEADINIDVESENDIMEQILLLAKKKSVLLISHRLANITKSRYNLCNGAG